VDWHLTHDRGPLPHLFRVLWPFWFMREHIGEARAWVDELLPTVDALDPQARPELLWTALANALDVGDDAAALAARDRLAPVLDRIQDPYLHVVSNLAMAWTSPIVGDFDDALRQAPVSLEESRGQDEPFWMALALGTAGALETVVGRYDDALGHLRMGRDPRSTRSVTLCLAAFAQLAFAAGDPERAALLAGGGRGPWPAGRAAGVADAAARGG
jgi:hypothetical protein